MIVRNFKINEAGNRYGKLIVIKPIFREDKKYTGTLWFCQCDCGNSVTVVGQSLRTGRTKSCGCHKTKNLTGQRFGRLVAVELIPGTRNWLCKCDCGNEKIVKQYNLRDRPASVKSCGCLKRDNVLRKRKEYGESSFNRLYKRLIRDAGYRGHKFLLTKEQVKELTKKPCFYCGNPPSQITMTKTGYGEYVYNGIDRFDNSLEYTYDNAVPCCGHCNLMKYRFSVEDFKNQVIAIYEHWVKS